MKKNIVIAVLALIVVGGGAFIIGEKSGEKNNIPETTENTLAVVENSNQAVVSPEATENVAEVITEIVTEKVDQHVVEAPVAPETTRVVETQPAPPAEKPTEAQRVSEPQKPTEAETKVNKKPQNVENTTEAVKTISRDEAKKIALNHADLKEADVRGLEVELDFERGAYAYEVSFESGKYEYEYEINATNGKIKFAKKEVDD